MSAPLIVTATPSHTLIVRWPHIRRVWTESSPRLTRDYLIDVTPEGDLIGEWEDDFLRDYSLLLEDEARAQGRSFELPEPFPMEDLESDREALADVLGADREHLTGPGLLP